MPGLCARSTSIDVDGIGFGGLAQLMSGVKRQVRTVQTLMRNNIIISAFLWQLSVFKKVLKISLGHEALAIVISIAARFARLLAVVLPLKAILVAGSSQVPGYLTRYFPNIELATVVMVLVILSIIFYLAYLLSGQIISRVLRNGANRITGKISKISAEYDVLEKTEALYKIIVKCQSAIIFSGFVIVVISLFYSKLALVILAILIVAWLLAILILQLRPAWSNWFYVNRTQLLERSLFVVIMLSFVVIINDTLQGKISSVILAVVAFILARQAINSVGEYVRLSISMYTTKNNINHLFFYNTLQDTIASREPSPWPSLAMERVKELCRTVLNSVAENADGNMHVTWRVTGVYNVLSLDVTVTPEPGGQSSHYLINVYNSDKLVCAEEMIMRAPGRVSLPAPKLLGRAKWEGYECMVLEWPGSRVLNDAEYTRSLLPLLFRMWSVPVNTKFFDSYLRAHPVKIASKNSSYVKNLELMAADQESLRNLKLLFGQFDNIKQIILDLPLSIYNPDIALNTVALRSDGNMDAIHWGRWSIQPIGTGIWDLEYYSNEEIEGLLRNLRKVRPDCDHITPDHIRLSSYFYQFLYYSDIQRYLSSLSCITPLLGCYRNIKN